MVHLEAAAPSVYESIMPTPTVQDWAGRVVRPSDTFQPICWGAGFHKASDADGFGVVIKPPDFEAEARLRIWRGAGQEFSIPGDPIHELRFYFTELLGDKPRHLPTLIWFPLPDIEPGFYLADVALLHEGEPRPFAVGYFPAKEWGWRAGD